MKYLGHFFVALIEHFDVALNDKSLSLHAMKHKSMSKRTDILPEKKNTVPEIHYCNFAKHYILPRPCLIFTVAILSLHGFFELFKKDLVTYFYFTVLVFSMQISKNSLLDMRDQILFLSFLALYVNSKRVNGEEEINVLTYAILMLICMIESHTVLKKNSVFSKAFLILMFSMLCILLQIVYRLVVSLLQERSLLWLDVSVCVGVITSQYFVRFFL